MLHSELSEGEVDDHNNSLGEHVHSPGVEPGGELVLSHLDDVLNELAVESGGHSLGDEWHDLGHEDHLQLVGVHFLSCFA